MYEAHPSRVLRELFASRPYQGVAPEISRFLFVGLDANYSADVELSPIFRALLDYHNDGPGFWRKYRVHHPFLLPGYAGDGRRYHRTFAQIGFTPAHAHLVSFVELLHVPTVGRNSLDPRDLSAPHLRRVNQAIFEGRSEYSFVSAGVARLMHATGQFPLLGKPGPPLGALRVLYRDPQRTVFLHLHFSNYGKFEAQLRAEADEIASLIHRGDA